MKDISEIEAHFVMSGNLFRTLSTLKDWARREHIFGLYMHQYHARSQCWLKTDWLHVIKVTSVLLGTRRVFAIFIMLSLAIDLYYSEEMIFSTSLLYDHDISWSKDATAFTIGSYCYWWLTKMQNLFRISLPRESSMLLLLNQLLLDSLNLCTEMCKIMSNRLREMTACGQKETLTRD